MLEHLVRRGVEVAAQHVSDKDLLEQQALAFARLGYQMPAWGIAIFAVTAVVLVFLSAAMDYTFRLLMVNLAIVESAPSATVHRYSAVAYSDDPDAPLEKKEDIVEVEVETAQLPIKPLTSSIRKTMKHLKSIGGFRSFVRGLGFYFIYTMVFVLAQTAVMAVLGRGMSVFLGPVLGSMAAARYHCGWTHRTISMPSSSQKGFCSGLVPRSQWNQLLLPNAVKAMSIEATMGFTGLVIAFSVNQLNDLARAENTCSATAVLVGLLPVFTLLAGWFFMIMPATVALTRIEASLLADDMETVVPIDRTFGGRLDNVFGKLSMTDAWLSFEGKGRLIKLYVKTMALTLALGFVFVHVFLFEAWAIMGQNFVVLLASGVAGVQFLMS